MRAALLFTLILFIINTADAKDQCLAFFAKQPYERSDAQIAALKDQTVSLVPHLRRYARSLTQNNSQADDLVQDTLAQAYRKLNLFEPGTNLRSWLFTIMRNLFITEYRRPTHESLTSSDGTDREYLYPDQLSDQYDNVLLKEALGLIKQLPKMYQDVFTVVAIEGISYEEAAEQLQIAVGTTKTRLSRGRIMLNALLDGVPIDQVVRPVGGTARWFAKHAVPRESKAKELKPRAQSLTPDAVLFIRQLRNQLSNLNVLGPAASSTSTLAQYRVRWNNSLSFVLSSVELDFIRLIVAANGEELSDNDLIAEIWFAGDTDEAQSSDSTELTTLAQTIQAKFAKAVPGFNKIQRSVNGWMWKP